MRRLFILFAFLVTFFNYLMADRQIIVEYHCLCTICVRMSVHHYTNGLIRPAADRWQRITDIQLTIMLPPSVCRVSPSSGWRCARTWTCWPRWFRSTTSRSWSTLPTSGSTSWRRTPRWAPGWGPWCRAGAGPGEGGSSVERPDRNRRAGGNVQMSYERGDLVSEVWPRSRIACYLVAIFRFIWANI